MKLTKLEIYGFKSFADRTSFHFDQGITGIVGPNGCGKSNIVDSIRWVLGEQKIKNLRSDKMLNIIFNGTKSRRKSNFAEVSLSFDNTKKLLPTAYTSVTITRRIYRNGNSEYLLNGTTCRLKDIQNLFIDTGIGSDSYSIIELKMVDQILNEKAGERRRLFEEAAGILKYKARKKETLKRLDATESDLERVEDLLFEMEKNLKQLEKQAKKAEKYLTLKTNYRKVSSQYAFLKLSHIAILRKEAQEVITNIQSELDELHITLRTKEAQQEELKRVLVGKEEELRQLQKHLNNQLHEIQKQESEKSLKEQRFRYLSEQQDSLEAQMKQAANRFTHNERQVEMFTQRLSELGFQLSDKKKECVNLKAKVDGLRSEHKQQETQVIEIRKEKDSCQKNIQELIRTSDRIRIKLQSISSERERITKDAQQKSQDIVIIKENRIELEKSVGQLEKDIKALEDKQEKESEARQQLEQNIQQQKDVIYALNRKKDAKQNEYKLIRSLVENLEGFPESVRYLRKQAHWLKQSPLLSDIFTCEDTYKVALENYLEQFLSYYVVESRIDAMRSIQLLSAKGKGRANFFLLDEIPSQGPVASQEHGISALNVIDYDERYKDLAQYLLGNVYIVIDHTKLPEKSKGNVVWLTQKGAFVQQRFVLSGGAVGLFEGKRLGRARNLKRLEQEINELVNKLSIEKNTLNTLQKRLAELKSRNFQKEINTQNKALIRLQRNVAVASSQYKSALQFLSQAETRKKVLNNEEARLLKEARGIEPDMKVLEEKQKHLDNKLNFQQQIVLKYTTRLSKISQKYNQANIAQIQQENLVNNAKRDLQQKEGQIKRYEQKRKDNEKVLIRLQQEQADLVKSLDELAESIIKKYKVKVSSERELTTVEQSLTKHKTNLISIDKNIHQIRHKVGQQQKVLQIEKDKEIEVRLEEQSIQERISVEFDIDAKSLVAEDLFDKPLHTYKVEKIDNQLLKLRNRIQKFGPVNSMAMEAFKEMEERCTFVKAQRQDLWDAKKGLKKTISEIDKTAEEKFMQTFSVVRMNFQRVFRRLFSEDDYCDLLLTNENAPLESGVDIRAQPKGKRPLTINQLSGGEKTLTAIALLFALYLYKPAPFCIFDEVDAPLDDANIDKFNRIIREFSTDSQFIIVTHNKRTMASTHIMYGVTMENLGVSRVLPVNLKALNLN